MLIPELVTSYTLQSLQKLIDQSVTESARLDFKRTTYGNGDADKKELLKDVVSFANTDGGVLVLGLDEQEGVATQIIPLEMDIDAEKQRLNAVLESCIEPRVMGLNVQSIEIGGQGHVILIAIPKSWNGPHRYAYKNTMRFYGRNSTGAYEYSMDNLKLAFERGNKFNELLAEKRRSAVKRLENKETPIPLIGGPGQILFQILPYGAFVETQVIQRTQRFIGNIQTLSGGPQAGVYNVDGYVKSDVGNYSYTQVYRDGSIEAVTSALSYSDPSTPYPKLDGSNIAKMLSEMTPHYLNFLKRASVQLPVRVFITLVNVRGHRFVTHTQREPARPSLFKTNNVFIGSADFLEYAEREDCVRIMRPLYDTLWNADGRESCNWFNPDGTLSASWAFVRGQ